MKICTRKQLVLLTALCGMLMSTLSSAQTYLRYIHPEDLGSKALYADSVLTSIRLPQGVASLANYPKFNVAALELLQIMNDPTKEVMQVYVCGSASPDGLWADNVKLSQARTDAAARYLRDVLDVPSYKIHSESLNEDWDRLYELVAASDMPYKYNVMSIIRSKEWGERKKALQQLDGGRAWRMLLDDFFPQLRCVRFAIFCKWDPGKPYMSRPMEAPAYQPQQQAAPVPEPAVAPQVKPAPVSKTDTVYVRDTVYMIKEVVYLPEPVKEPAPAALYETVRTETLKRTRKVWDTPWHMGLKTNLLADAMVIPQVGLELQLARNFSLDLQGWMTNYNILTPEDRNASIYGFAPEVRWWRNDAMRTGSFLGVHANCAWYTLQWNDLLYQNGPEDVWEGNYHDSGNQNPAWSVGLTYGYVVGLGPQKNWGLEFVVGLGYGRYSQNTAALSGDTWMLVEHQSKHHFGITRAGINLTYRFNVRRVNQEY